MNEKLLQRRVERGAKWLDETKPGWVEAINVGALEMEDCARCVLGQTFGNYWSALEDAHPVGPNWDEYHKQDAWACERGFNADDGDYDALREAWLPLIRQRRSVSTQGIQQ